MSRTLGLLLAVSLPWEIALAQTEPAVPASEPVPVAVSTPMPESPLQSGAPEPATDPQSPTVNGSLQAEAPPAGQQEPNAYQLSTLHQTQRGLGSWYGPGFHGRRTASGLLFDMHAFTAAHRTLPLLSYVKVTLADTGVHIIAQITDRGPFIKGRIIDLSKGAASALGLLPKGLAPVIVEPIVSISASQLSQ